MALPVSRTSIKKVLERVSVRSLEDSLEEDQDLFSTLVLDSYSLIEFMIALEETFEIVIDPVDLGREHFSTIDGIIKLLSSKYGCPAE